MVSNHLTLPPAPTRCPQDRSETLFYHLIIENVIEMMPLICESAQSLRYMVGRLFSERASWFTLFIVDKGLRVRCSQKRV